MYSYHQEANICFAYLADVNDIEVMEEDEEGLYDAGDSTEVRRSRYERHFQSSRWFTRGWTLQELIAPQHVEFYSRRWKYMSFKFSLSALISHAASINATVLATGLIDSCSIAEKFYWASNRQTTRAEDTSYCLLGIFGVKMPLLYGEGQAAFRRLQEVILPQQEDPSLFLWSATPGNPWKMSVKDEREVSISDVKAFSVLAKDPVFFASYLSLARYPEYCTCNCDLFDLLRISMVEGREIVRSLPEVFPYGDRHLNPDPPAMTSRGLLMSLCVLQFKVLDPNHVGLLYVWTYYMIGDNFLCMVLKPLQMATDVAYLRLGDLQSVPVGCIRTSVQTKVILGLKDVDLSATSYTVQNFAMPTLVISGIDPSLCSPDWWNKIYIGHKYRRSSEPWDAIYYQNKGPNRKTRRKKFQLELLPTLKEVEDLPMSAATLTYPSNVHVIEMFLIAEKRTRSSNRTDPLT